MFQQQFSDISQLDRLQFSSSWTPTIQVIADPVKGSAPRAPCFIHFARMNHRTQENTTYDYYTLL